MDGEGVVTILIALMYDSDGYRLAGNGSESGQLANRGAP